MVEWILDVYIHKRTFPEYEKLVEELKKIPDVAVMANYSKRKRPLKITTVDINNKYTQVFNIHYENAQVKVVIHNKSTGTIVERREAFADNAEKAIQHIIEYARYALAKITKDIKYIRESDEGLDDISQIKAVNVRVFPMSEDTVLDYLELIDFLNITQNCKIIKKYNLEMVYAYPHTARGVWGAIFCCPNQCYLYIVGESQEGEFHGNKRFVIDLNENKPTKETLKEILKTRVDLLMDIERYIRETLEQRT